MSKATSKPTALNKHQGGSYLRDPKTGELTLVAQTKHREITGFEEAETVTAQAPTTFTKKDAK